MPSGKTHAFMTGTVASLAIFAPFPRLDQMLLFVFGCLFGLVVYPDLDVDVGNYGIYLIRNVFGETVSKLWQLFWYPYAKIAAHRGFLSHFPVISSVFRIAYVGFPVYILLRAYHHVEWSEDIYYALAGLFVVDTLHIVSDIISTTIKRKF